MKEEYTAKDFADAVKNPYIGKFIKDNKYTVIIEHEGYNEIAEVDMATGSKIKLKPVEAQRKCTDTISTAAASYPALFQ